VQRLTSKELLQPHSRPVSPGSLRATRVAALRDQFCSARRSLATGFAHRGTRFAQRYTLLVSHSFHARPIVYRTAYRYMVSASFLRSHHA
jgi:hypothetical protein